MVDENWFEAGVYKFQKVDSFVYPESQLNSENDISKEISRRIVAANRCYFALIKHFRSRFLSKSTKIKLYKTMVRPVLTYGSEAWAFTKLGSNIERCLLRRMFGPTRRRRKNLELYIDIIKIDKDWKA